MPKASHQPLKTVGYRPSELHDQLSQYRIHDDQAAEFLAKIFGLFSASDRASLIAPPAGSRVYTSQPEDIQTKKQAVLNLSHQPQTLPLASLFLRFEQPYP
jgi:hypothetical protein